MQRKHKTQQRRLLGKLKLQRTAVAWQEQRAEAGSQGPRPIANHTQPTQEKAGAMKTPHTEAFPSVGGTYSPAQPSAECPDCDAGAKASTPAKNTSNMIAGGSFVSEKNLGNAPQCGAIRSIPPYRPAPH
jgi:hypothetical protein